MLPLIIVYIVEVINDQNQKTVWFGSLNARHIYCSIKLIA